MGARTALVIPASTGTGRGGVQMRMAALHAAMASAVPCELVELRCDRYQGCRARCAVTGGLPAGCAVKNYHDRAFCEDYASQLIRQFVADRVSVVVCSHLFTYRYAVRFAESGRLRVILDIHNVESVLSHDIRAALPDGSPAKRWTHTEGHVAAVRAVELAAVGAADELWTCSERDRALAMSTFGLGGKRVVVVPNAVQVTDPPPAAKPSRIVFTGRLDYYPNTLAALFLIDEVAPRLTALGCQVPIVIAGADPPPALRARPLPDGVTVLPDPESTADLINGSIMAVPLTLGGGTRFKILEAFQCGAPVVSTVKGAEGLDLTAEVHYLPGEDADAFAGALSELARNAPLRERLATSGWSLLRDRYSTGALRSRLAATFRTHSWPQNVETGGTAPS